ncbi:proteasome beta2 subunit-like protein [Dinothrombium tinctorium]|uniref:proteasome endopeptidase complex n=1 Tax=Dinothrombium tinctorium TaxID=1965070 RepID=A0A3S3P9I2_9ACAR|nr:proteasome beta2 subunit-like protein [Dinothrombium tinctorium]RWS10745.1 proteasome beta2 subunit-like protein [Dinothrombium tinctorium]RWS10747.1 proteasome beta2 subunit-like protein [Dinothrombium tinctorium]
MALLPDLPKGGFVFENFQRNEFLKAKGFRAPKATKTGTTIVGCLVKDGVILGADTRATSGSVIADKYSDKIHYMAKNIYCCGAGTAADTLYVTRMVSSNLELHRLNTNRVVPVICALRMLKQHLFRYQGYVSAALVLAGVDEDGAHLYSVTPHGSSDKLPFTTMGSGSLAAMAVFETRWKPNMTIEEGKKLVRDSVAAGIFNDLGSGNNIDMCIITRDGVDYMRPYEEANLKGQRLNSYVFDKGATPILTVHTIPLEVEEVMVRHMDETMDTSA